MGPPKKQRTPPISPKKKLHDDALSPPKRPIFHIAKLEPINPADPHSDLFWGSPTGKSSSQYVVQMLDEKESDAKSKAAAQAKHGRFPPLSPDAKGARRTPSRSRSPVRADSPITLASPSPNANAKAQSKQVAFARSAFSSAQPQMTEAEQKEYYQKVYPFNYLTLADFKKTADSVERVYRIESMTGHKSGSRTMEAVVLYCRFLESDSPLTLKTSVLVDLMADGGEVALYGSAFDFKRIINIELTERGKATTKKLVGSIAGLDEYVSVLVGTFRDYFPVDAQVYYMDCGWVCDGRSMVDEFVLIRLLFELCSKIEQHGTAAYLCLLTQCRELEPVRDFGARHMKTLLRTVIHFGRPDECVAWIFQVLPQEAEKKEKKLETKKIGSATELAQTMR